MDRGETSLVEIGPRFAYGSQGNGKDIPSNATILYTIELVDVTQDQDIESVSLDDRLRIGFVTIVNNTKLHNDFFLMQKCETRTRKLVVQPR